VQAGRRRECKACRLRVDFRAKLLAFAYRHNDGDIYRFEPGRPDTPVVSSSAWDQTPTYSPDGRRIAFDSGRSGVAEEIWVADADGSNAVQLTHGPGAWQGGASWSPDGRQIAFDSRGQDGYFDIWIIGADGGTPRRLTWGPLKREPAQLVPGWAVDLLPGGTRGQSRHLAHSTGWRAGTTRDQWGRVPRGRVTRRPHAGLRAARRRITALRATGRRGTARQVVDCVVSRSLAAGPDGIFGQIGTGGGFVPGMTVAPDGSHVLFSKLVSEGSDVMLIDNYRCRRQRA
jgi:WD40-like Beta Propeller Repeat